MLPSLPTEARQGGRWRRSRAVMYLAAVTQRYVPYGLLFSASGKVSSLNAIFFLSSYKLLKTKARCAPPSRAKGREAEKPRCGSPVAEGKWRGPEGSETCKVGVAGSKFQHKRHLNQKGDRASRSRCKVSYLLGCKFYLCFA